MRLIISLRINIIVVVVIFELQFMIMFLLSIQLKVVGGWDYQIFSQFFRKLLSIQMGQKQLSFYDFIIKVVGNYIGFQIFINLQILNDFWSSGFYIVISIFIQKCVFVLFFIVYECINRFIYSDFYLVNFSML